MDNQINVLDNGFGWVRLLDHMGDETTIVNAARISFNNVKDTFDERDQKLLKYLIKNRHTTPLEHVTFTFSVHCPLYVRSQWMRHRIASYNEVSRRYTDEEIEFYIPNTLRKQSDSNRQASTDQIVKDNDQVVTEYKTICENAYNTYLDLLSKGVCREQARGILPQNMMTTFWFTVNLHSLLHFISLREDNHAQKEIQEYAVAMKKLVQPYIPHVIDAYDSLGQKDF